MQLSAPTTAVFIITVIIAIIGILSALGALAFLPIAGVWIMTLAYVVLAAACLLKGM